MNYGNSNNNNGVAITISTCTILHVQQGLTDTWEEGRKTFMSMPRHSPCNISVKFWEFLEAVSVTERNSAWD